MIIGLWAEVWILGFREGGGMPATGHNTAKSTYRHISMATLLDRVWGHEDRFNGSCTHEDETSRCFIDTWFIWRHLFRCCAIMSDGVSSSRWLLATLSRQSLLSYRTPLNMKSKFWLFFQTKLLGCVVAVWGNIPHLFWGLCVYWTRRHAFA